MVEISSCRIFEDQNFLISIYSLRPNEYSFFFSEPPAHDVFTFSDEIKTSSGKIERSSTINRSFPSLEKTSTLLRAWYDWRSCIFETYFPLNMPFIEATGCEIIWFLEEGKVIVMFSPEKVTEKIKSIMDRNFIVFPYETNNYCAIWLTAVIYNFEWFL
mgnify:CR=1 FL=1